MTLSDRCGWLVCVAERLQEVERFMMNCEMSRLMQDLIGHYIMMEEYFMREMVLKVRGTL